MKKQLIVISALFIPFFSQCMFSNMFNKAKESASSLASKAASTVKQGASTAISKATPIIQQQTSKAVATIQQQGKEALEQAVIKAQEQSGALIGQASQHASNIMETGAARIGSSIDKRAGAVISKIGGNTVVSAPVSDQAALVEEEPVVDSVAASKAALMERFKGN
jgi:hypothetical protein